MVTTSLDIPEKLDTLLNYLVEEGFYSSRSEAFRASLRNQHSEIWEKVKKEEIE